MKQTIMIGAVALMLTTLVACSNEKEPRNPLGELHQVTINASTESLNTRAESEDISRYAISIWEDSDYVTPANIFTGNTNLETSEDGNFTLTLNTKKEYHCLLWADNGETYELGSSLKDVTVASGKVVTEAFHGKLELAEGRTESYTVTLRRAVAHFSLLETGNIPAGYQMSFSWTLPNSFNVATASPEGEEIASSVSWSSEELSGSQENPVVLKDKIYVLASPDTKVLRTFAFRCNEEDPVEITNVPIRANYKTNIKGHFTTTEYVNFSVNHDSEWGNNEEEKEF